MPEVEEEKDRSIREKKKETKKKRNELKNERQKRKYIWIVRKESIYGW